MKNKSTYSLEILRKTVCQNEDEIVAVEYALNTVLELNQWAYQNTDDHQQYRDAKNAAIKARDKVVKLLRLKGDNTLANQVADALAEYPKDSTITRGKVLSNAKKVMKEECLIRSEITIGRYNKDFSEYMELAFIELCQEYPLENAPDYFDSGFDPYSY